MAEEQRLELWGGVECTVARIQDIWRDQVAETGHRDRSGDIDLIAGLGIRTVRYPILWETIAPMRPDRLDFGWTDDRLAMLRERGIQVIGGLLHHGSGPAYTNLLDPDFATKLGDYAARVADRYPWIEAWTPVNEPLTTARFSGLYGHWYPHRGDEAAFLRILMNECRGTLEAMRAIRAAIPNATLIQTEDLGKTYSTAPLRSQATYENDRRWLSFDALCGRIDAAHPMFGSLTDAGIAAAEIEAFESGEARPDLLGINHYLTSERFLDHRLHLYPGHPIGGNGRDRYVDAEAVRVKTLDSDTGIGARLREAWQRYRIPMAITEVHHGCTRDEQLRWFAETWRTAGELRDEDIDVRAVTLWSLFGNVDWRSLLTEQQGTYDTGAFDARGLAPRPTVIARAASHYANERSFDHPALDSPGWWRRPPRLYPWNGHCKPMDWGGRKLLITGATGTLGNAFARICEARALPFCLTERSKLDICDRASVDSAFEHFEPWAVINAAGFVRVGDAAREQAACFAWNADGAENLAAACERAGVPLVTFSSDLVFDGRLGAAYDEDHPPSPTCTYGRSKAEAERRVLAAASRALVIRTSAFFGPWDRHNFGWHVLESLSRGESVSACPRTFVSPTFVPDLCHAALDLLIDGETGIWHLANQGRISWYDFACAIAEGAGYDRAAIVAAAGGEERSRELTSRRGILLRPLTGALVDWLADIREAEALQLTVAAE